MSDTQPAPAPAKKSRSFILIVVALVVTAGGVGAGAFWYARKTAAPHEAPKPKPSDHGLISFQPFVVNLADPGGSRFLRATVKLVVDSPAKAKEAEETPVLINQARSKILELLAQQTADKLITPEGKAELKKAIAEHLAESLEDLKVVDVLFSDFVVQF